MKNAELIERNHQVRQRFDDTCRELSTKIAELQAQNETLILHLDKLIARNRSFIDQIKARLYS